MHLGGRGRKKKKVMPGLVAHSFDSSKQMQADLFELKASLVYKVSPGQSGLHGETLSQKPKE